MSATVFRCSLCWLFLLAGVDLSAGPYSAALNDPANTHDAPVPGFVGPDGIGGARISDGSGGFLNTDNYVNPIFFDWASSVINYSPAPGVASTWSNPALSLGPVTGDDFNVVSLGDLSSSQIASSTPPGMLTLHFTHPIRNLSGADFVVYENGSLSGFNTGGAGSGGIFGELAYVEVSSDGINFVRFPSVSLTPSLVGSYGTIDPTNVFNLMGKHVNAYGDSWGTPFDLSDVGLDSISYIRIVDIPGSGFFKDSLGNPIYDAWLTIGSGGVDVEAIGTISRLMTFNEWQDLNGLAGATRGATVDAVGNGVPNLLKYAFTRQPTRLDGSPALTSVALESGRLVITFTRDERASDLLYEVQVSDTLSASDWTTVAQSTGGQAMAAVGAFTPTIEEASASAITSIGVIRRVRVTDVVSAAGRQKRYMRVKVTQLTTP
ncbi:hypothetical protein CfE428DRAFT_2133 [Chthoniobacter flavus Ellin428]|uniref:Cell surface protein n=1 Tax=Chthoniobacter flavus Ellin428 TaxID=497964 RepID=B4CZP5_9BACT|nr:hypothetical protein [Chthoniobacter flavus]EDY20209.1 hypothetical protein CfE428DRAFT_2133 [Chthoniobacter flavus Ellin428]TCO94106.1 hypothetical protein EV701_103194 [Chthoniobacter flavus]